MSENPLDRWIEVNEKQWKEFLKKVEDNPNDAFFRWDCMNYRDGETIVCATSKLLGNLPWPERIVAYRTQPVQHEDQRYYLRNF